MAVLRLLTIPFAILNFFGVLGGAIWLAILGKWTLLGIGLASMFISATALGLVLMPGTLVSMLAMPFFGRRVWFLGFPFVLAGSVYTNAVVGVWCYLVTALFVKKAGDGAMFPALLWAYGVAIAPLSYMTAKGGPEGGVGDVLVTFCAQIAMVTMGIVSLVRGFELSALVWVCAVVMSIATLLHATLAFLMMRESAKEAALRRLFERNGPERINA